MLKSILLEASLNKIVLIVGSAVAVVVAAVAGQALWKYHENPEFCVLCHVMDPYLASWQGSDLLANTHAQSDLACLDCHEPTIPQQVSEVFKYVTKQYEQPLAPVQFPNEFCLSCKEHGSYEDLAERTKAYVVNGQLMNPHDPHPNPDPRIPEHFECWHCHSMHKTSRGIDYCWGCHHGGEFEDCRDCH
jgi:cytochrome c nitrite reductase small subunit